MATVSTVEDVAFPFDGELDIDELDVIGASNSTRSTTVLGDATPPGYTPPTFKLDTLVIPARKTKRSRTPSLSEKEGPLMVTLKKQKIEDKKAVSPNLGRFPCDVAQLTCPMSHVSISRRAGIVL